MNDIYNILGMAGLASLVGQCIAWAFDPIQWLKRWLALDFDSVGERYKGDPIAWSQPLRVILHKLISKLVNCDACCSFWACMAIGLPTIGMTTLIAAPLAFTISAMISRVLPME